MTEYFTLMSFNCNGLNDKSKRQDVFNLLHEKKCNIYFLQETHLRERDLAYHRASWGLEMFLAGHDSNRGGCAILLNNNFEYKVINVESDPNGHYIIIQMESCNKKFVLVTVYGPSAGDNFTFFNDLNTKLLSYRDELIIIGGDWNCVLNPTIDRKNCRTDVNRPRTRAAIENLMNDYNLFDVYRELYKDKASYTWRRFNSNKYARLDYFLVSEPLVHETKSVVTNSSYRSDHSPVILSLNKSSFKRERTFWKFNNSLLYDKDYVKQIKTVIHETKMQYCSFVYNLEKIDQIHCNEINFRISDQLLFETLMFEIRGKTISYSTHKKRKEDEREKLLFSKIDNLENSTNENRIDELDRLKLEVQEIRDKKNGGYSFKIQS